MATGLVWGLVLGPTWSGVKMAEIWEVCTWLWAALKPPIGVSEPSLWVKSGGNMPKPAAAQAISLVTGTDEGTGRALVGINSYREYLYLN